VGNVRPDVKLFRPTVQWSSGAVAKVMCTILRKKYVQIRAKVVKLIELNGQVFSARGKGNWLRKMTRGRKFWVRQRQGLKALRRPKHSNALAER